MLIVSLLIAALALAAVIPGALRQNTPVESPEPARMEKDTRAIVFRAYKSLKDQRAHGLHLLTACIYQEHPDEKACIYALSETKKNLGRFDTSAIDAAITELEK